MRLKACWISTAVIAWCTLPGAAFAQQAQGAPCDAEIAALAEKDDSGYQARENGKDAWCEGTYKLPVANPVSEVLEPLSLYYARDRFEPRDCNSVHVYWPLAPNGAELRGTHLDRDVRYRLDLQRPPQPAIPQATPYDEFVWSMTVLKNQDYKSNKVQLLCRTWRKAAKKNSVARRDPDVLLPIVIKTPNPKQMKKDRKALILTLRSEHDYENLQAKLIHCDNQQMGQTARCEILADKGSKDRPILVRLFVTPGSGIYELKLSHSPRSVRGSRTGNQITSILFEAPTDEFIDAIQR